jgi:hypothetical protein
MTRTELSEWNRRIRDNPEVIKYYSGIKFVMTDSMETMHFEYIPNFKGMWLTYIWQGVSFVR